MKKYTFALLVSIGTLSLMSFTHIPQGDKIPQCAVKQPITTYTAPYNNDDTTEEVITIVDEDFSGLTQGTEDYPDTTPMQDDMGWMTDPSLFKPYDPTCTNGWGGYKIYQAGGTIAILDGGFLNTPTGDYSGTLKMTFRIKRLSGQEYNGDPNVELLLCRRSVLTDFKRVAITPTNEWQEFTFEADNGWYFDCMIQFYTPGNLSYLIDDIKITHVITSIAPPEIAEGMTKGDESFMAYWHAIPKATEYLISVFSKVESPNNIDAIQGWETLNPSDNDPSRLDTQDPGIPEGWELNLTTYGNNRELYTDTEYTIEGKQAICFDADGDYFATPPTDNVITDFALWLKLDNRTTGQLPENAALKIYVMSNGIMPGEWFEAHTGSLKDLFTQATSGTIDIIALLNGYAFPPCERIKIEFYNPYNEDFAVAIDEVILKIPAPMDNVYFIEDQVVPAKGEEMDSVLIDNLDPAVDYFYHVKARNLHFTSPASEEMEVYDVSDPIALDITDQTENAYTVHWTSNPKVDYFTIQQHITKIADKDEQEYVILEEDFSKVISKGTAENPEIGEYRFDYEPINEYTHMPGWLASSFSLANGMIGGLATQEGEGLAGCIQTPEMNLVHHNQGVFDVYIRAYAQKGDFLNISGKDSYLTYAYIEFVETGWQELKIEGMSSYQTEEVLAIYVNSYGPFMLDYIKVVQNVKAGETIRLTCGRTIVDDPDQRELNVDYAYFKQGYTTSYTVNAYRYYHGNTSDPWSSPRSNEVIIPTPHELSIGQTNNDQNLHIQVIDKEAYITLDQPSIIYLYTADGQLLYSCQGNIGTNHITLTTGFYLIRVGTKTGKVTVL